MEAKDTKNHNVDLPPYIPFPKTKQPKKKWIVGLSAVFLLALTIVGSTLIGVYLTQKHTETMVTMALSSQDVNNFQQTALVNEQQDVAVFIVLINSSSTTVLFDYKQGIIGIRTSNSSVCYLLRMGEVQTPSILEILKMIRNFQTNKTLPSKLITYSITPTRKADVVHLGMNIKILCCDVPTYWSEMMSSKRRIPEDKEKPKDKPILVIQDGPLHIIV